MSDRIVSTFTTVGTAHGTDYLPILVQTSPGSYANCKIAVSDFSTDSNGSDLWVNSAGTLQPADSTLPVRISTKLIFGTNAYVYSDGVHINVIANDGAGYPLIKFGTMYATSIATVGGTPLGGIFSTSSFQLDFGMLGRQYTMYSGGFLPNVANAASLGAYLIEWKDVWLAGTAYFDGYTDGTNYTRLGIHQNGNGGAIVLDSQAEGSGIGSPFEFQSNGVTQFTVSREGDISPRNVNYRWPVSAASGVLTCDGSGSLSWGTASGTSGDQFWGLSGGRLQPLDSSLEVRVSQGFVVNDSQGGVGQLYVYGQSLDDISGLSGGLSIVQLNSRNLGSGDPTNFYGFLTSNQQSATALQQQNSPAVTWVGQGWSSDLSDTETVIYSAYAVVSAGAMPTAQWVMKSFIGDGTNKAERTVMSVASDSGYTGSGTNFLADDGTYHLINGSLVNPTDYYVPYRYNGTFNDSALRMLPDYGANAMGFDQPNSLGSFMVISPQSEFVTIQGSTGNGDWNTIGKGLFYATAYNVNDPMKHLPYQQGLLLNGEASGTTTSNTPAVVWAGRGYNGDRGFPDTVFIGAYGEIFDGAVGPNLPTGRLVFKSYIGTYATNGMMEIDIVGNGTFSGNVSVRAVPYIWPTSSAAGALTNDGSGNLTWTETGSSSTSGTYTSGGIVAYSTFSTGTTLADLQPGEVRLNDPDAYLATMLYISRLGYNGAELTPDLLTIVNIGDYITLTQPTNLNVSWTYRVTALALSSGDAINGKIRIGVEQYNISTPAADDGAEVLLTVDISGSSSSSSSFASPTALLGLTAVTGSGTEAMRANAAPALDQNISPTWTGSHTYNKGVFVGTNAEAYWTQPITTEVYVAYSNVALGDPALRDTYLTVESDGNGTTYGQTFDTVEVDITKRLQSTTINGQDFYWRNETGNDGSGNGFVTSRAVVGTSGIVTLLDPTCSENTGCAYLFDTSLVPINTPTQIASFSYQGAEKFVVGTNGYGTYATGLCIGTTQQLRLNTNNGGHIQMGYVDGFPTMDIGVFRIHDRGETGKAWINIAKVDTWPSYTAGGEWWANCGTSDCVMDISWLDGAGTSRDHVWTTGDTDAFFVYEMKRNGTVCMSLQPCIANSPSNVAYTFDTWFTLNAASTKIASFRNKTVEKASIGADGSGTLAGNLYASNTVFGVGTVPVSSAVSGTLYYDFAGSAYQQTTASGTIMVSAKNYRPGIAIVAQIISDGTARAITYDSTFAWFGTQVPSTVATSGKQILVTLTSTSNAASGVIAASTPQI